MALKGGMLVGFEQLFWYPNSSFGVSPCRDAPPHDKSGRWLFFSSLAEKPPKEFRDFAHREQAQGTVGFSRQGNAPFHLPLIVLKLVVVQGNDRNNQAHYPNPD